MNRILSCCSIVTAGGGAGGCGAGNLDNLGDCIGATGGSGVVIISYPAIFKAAVTTGKNKNITNSGHTLACNFCS